MLVYLNEAWPPEADAETLFLDPGSGTGVLVRYFSSVLSCPKFMQAAMLPEAFTWRAARCSAWCVCMAPCVLPTLSLKALLTSCWVNVVVETSALHCLAD